MKHKTRAIKVIRSTMEEIEMLLQRNSECADRIKVIHLLRDPRGKFNSHLHLPTFRFYIMYKYTREIKQFINLCCSRMLQDITLRKKLETFYPSSFLELHYEQIANNFSKAVEEIYDFILKDRAPPAVNDFISVLRHHKMKKGVNRAVMKSNSSQRAVAWKSQLSVQDLTDIERSSCRSIISYLKYPFLSKW